jgi:hypothetical protein
MLSVAHMVICCVADIAITTYSAPAARIVYADTR